MKTKNKKGFSLIMAIMIVTVLVIMAAGFFSVTDFSTKSIRENTENLRLYWAAESASNYNVNWWANQPDSIRKQWPNVYVLGSKLTEISDLAGTQVKDAAFKNAAETTEDGILYMHPSSVYEGNAGETNPELAKFDDLQLITTRYKGSRKDFPDQAVWVLDSYAYNPKTGDIANVCLANVYNYIAEAELEPFQHSELITNTMAGTGFHGCKGRFNEQDTRYGPVYYGDIVHFDYITAATKDGPTFYGLVKSAAWHKETEVLGYDATSWYKNDGNRFTDKTGDYYYGLGINSALAKSEADAVNNYASTSLLGGYDKMAKPLNTDNVVWTWPSVEEYGPDAGIYFLDEKKFFPGETIKVVLNTYTDLSGDKSTVAYIFGNGKLKEKLPVGTGTGAITGVAVREDYGIVQIQGVTDENFTLVTQRDQVQITDHLYSSGTDPILSLLSGLSPTTQFEPPESLLASIWAMMLNPSINAHIAVVAGLDMTPEDIDKTAPIYIPVEKFVFSTAAYITKFGELNAKGTGRTDLRFYNIGPVMSLEKQTIMTGPSDTAQKWPKIFIQDQRYLREGEPLPPFCGVDPGAHPTEALMGLNPNHRWASSTFSNTKYWQEVVWRNGKPNF